jgi:hypothetical protein
MSKIAVSLMILLSVPVWANQDIVIVGYPTMAKLSDEPCSEYLAVDEEALAADLEAECMDSVFHLSYEVLEVLEGDFSGESIDLIDLYHYQGLPDHLYVTPACVRIAQKSGYLLHRETVPAVRNRGGYTCEIDAKE